jgi:alkanesulfonate monooxygenase SsuD/methylene tetrahydromethanopterin reductase-like flavin-dependent oxidoreductase (luciferase family)
MTSEPPHASSWATPPEGQAFYADLKRRATAVGRDPDGVKILPGIVPVLGSTEVEARALDAELEQLIVAEQARSQLAHLLRVEPARRADPAAPRPDADRVRGDDTARALRTAPAAQPVRDEGRAGAVV